MTPQHYHIQPGLLLVLLWSTIELEGRAVKMLQVADGVQFGRTGSSGRFSKYLSSFHLKSSTLILVKLLIDFGRELKILPPLTWKLVSLRFLTFEEPFKTGIETSLPLLLSIVDVIPQLGTRPSKIFQTQIALYLSDLLSCDSIFRCFSLCQQFIPFTSGIFLVYILWRSSIFCKSPGLLGRYNWEQQSMWNDVERVEGYPSIPPPRRVRPYSLYRLNTSVFQAEGKRKVMT